MSPGGGGARRRGAPVAGNFWRGRVVIDQPTRDAGGYRFSLDAVLLAGFCPAARRVLDLGAGCGVVGLLVLASGAAREVVAVERLPALAAFARHNRRANRLDQRLHVVEGDLRRQRLGRFDLVVFNPPYFPARSGSAAPEPSRDAARHERAGTLDDFVAAADRALTRSGQVAVVVREERAAELAGLMAARRLWPQIRRPVAPRPGATGRLALALFSRRPGPPRHLRPWLLHPPVGPERFAAHLRAWVESGRRPPAPRPGRPRAYRALPAPSAPAASVDERSRAR